MRKRPKARFVNGIASAIIVAFFAVHALLGSLEGILNLPSPPSWIIWAGVAVVVFHVIASAITSYQQLSDKEFPPSARKKRHLALKWITGGLLAATVVTHIACVWTLGPHAAQVTVTGALAVIALTIVLAVHVCVGAKSLLVDLGLNKHHMKTFRAVAIVIAVAVGVFVIAGFLL